MGWFRRMWNYWFCRIWTLVWNTLRRTQPARLPFPLPVPTETSSQSARLQKMICILNTLNELQKRFGTSTGSSSRSAFQEAGFQAPRKINDYVHEVYQPEGTPSCEIVFFHGFQLEKVAHVTTWISEDKSEWWLNWLSEDFPDSRILTISYDGFPRRMDEQGRKEMYITSENLLQSLIESGAEIGQNDCPVILIGHSLGGLVMKELCLQAHFILSLQPRDAPDKRVKNFLENLRGLFTYATLPIGARLFEEPLFGNMTALNQNIARQAEEFRQLRNEFNWRTFQVGEHLPMPVSKQSRGYIYLWEYIFTHLKAEDFEAGVQKIVKKLVRAPRLALVGIGGIGKTTLAKAVFDRISQNYEYVCFLDEVKSVMAKQETTEAPALRSEIVKGLKRRNRQVKSLFNWSRLKGKKVLIVLDDAELRSHVMVMTKEDGFSEESRVIVTCREEGFLEQLDFEIHRVAKLNCIQSERLFCMHAFKNPMVPRRFEERVQGFVKKCSGFPLALKVCGSYLYKREGGVWDDAMEKLTRAQTLNKSKKGKLLLVLRMSYDSLTPLEQQMFLDVATCFHGKSLKVVQEAWRWCSWASAAARSGWKKLLDRCLVSESLGNGRIFMDKELRDMARGLVGHTRMVVDLLAAKQLLNEEKATIKILIIDEEYSRRGYLRTSEECGVVLSGLEKLEILWLRNVNLSYMELQCQALRHLKVENCWTSRSSRISLPRNFRPEQLQALESLEIIQSFRMSNDELLESDEELSGPDEELSEPDEELSEPDEGLWNDLIELWDSVGELGAQRSLHIDSCDSLRALSNRLGQLHRLEHLIIDHCTSLKELPESVGQLGTLRSLDIKSCESLRALPNTLGQLHSLEHLIIDHCTSLKELPESVGQLCALQALKLLHIIDCHKLTSLPESLGHLRALRHLEIRCRSLKAVPNNLGQLQALEKLKFEACDELTWLPESIDQLQSLKRLTICRCSSFIHLPSALGKLRALEKLRIDSCPKLAVFPEFVGQHSALRRFIISSCKSLKVLPNSLGELQALEKLIVRGCTELAMLPESIGQLHALQALWIVGCSRLEQFPINLGQFRTLEKLIIRDCPRVMVVPESIDHLRALRHLEVTHRNHSMIHPNELVQLHSLGKVTIHPEFQDLYRRTLPKSVEVGAGKLHNDHDSI